MSCECPADGFCERYQREMVGRLREICAGTVLTPEKCETYRANWLAMLPKHTAPCAHLGEATGRTIKCGTCRGGVKIKVFECGKFGECTLEKPVGIATCRGCEAYQPVLTPDAARQYIGPPAKRDKIWQHAPLTQQAMRVLIDEAAAKDYPPQPMDGRGIVISGGGKYFAMAYVVIRTLRRLGCKLPIELWHLGAEEMNDAQRTAAESLGGVTICDARLIGPGARILCGWESKPYSVLYSRFAEVLYLDADNVPARDPEYLFDAAEYLATGAIFWPDLPNGKDWIPADTWDVTGVPPDNRGKPAFETGQFIIDKRKCWRELNLTMHINEYSDCWYEYVYGDKDTFKLAWHKLGTDYAMPPSCYGRSPAIVQKDLSGAIQFYHLAGAWGGKVKLAEGTAISCISEPARSYAVQSAQELRLVMSDIGLGLPNQREALERYSREHAASEPCDNATKTKALGRFTLYCDHENTAEFTQWLASDGYWETWVTLALLRYCNKPYRCINVGANVGYYSMLLGKMTGQPVIAYEPVPRNCDLIRRSAADNALAVDVRQQAVWSERCVKPFYIMPNSGTSSFFVDGTPIEVECVKLDDEIEATDLIFVDAEGAEEHIYRGSERLRQTARMILEVSPYRDYSPGWLASVFAEYPNARWLDYDGNLTPINALPEGQSEVMIYLSKVD